MAVGPVRGEGLSLSGAPSTVVMSVLDARGGRYPGDLDRHDAAVYS